MENNDSFTGRLKRDLSNKGWWYGAAGGILSTVIGIALTFGVSAWVTHRNDQKLAREMMFHVLMTTENNIDGFVMTDSIDSVQTVATEKFLKYYQLTNGHLESIADSVPEDTIQHYLADVFACINLKFTRSKTEDYFYSAQTMHQFGDPQLYADFALFVQRDKDMYDMIDDIYQQSANMYRKYRTAALLNSGKKNYSLIALQKMIEDGYLVELNSTIYTLNCKAMIKIYNDYIQKLLKEMKASPQEYEEYKQAHTEQ